MYRSRCLTIFPSPIFVFSIKSGENISPACTLQNHIKSEPLYKDQDNQFTLKPSRKPVKNHKEEYLGSVYMLRLEGILNANAQMLVYDQQRVRGKINIQPVEIAPPVYVFCHNVNMIVVAFHLLLAFSRQHARNSLTAPMSYRSLFYVSFSMYIKRAYTSTMRKSLAEIMTCW